MNRLGIGFIVSCSLSVSLGLTSLAFAEPAFSTHARDNNADDVRRVLGLIKPGRPGAQNGSGRGMGFFVSNHPEKKIIGVDLVAKRVAWSEPADVKSRIAVGAGLVAHRQGDELVGRDPASGKIKLRVKIPQGAKFIGATVDEDRLFYVLQSNAGAKRTSDLVALDHGGSEKWRETATGSLGAPSARGGLVAVPFAYQNLVFLDGKNGKELARIRATDAQISYVRATPEGFFYGSPERGLVLFDEKSIAGQQKDSSLLAASLGSDQVKPAYHWDGYQSAQVDYSAFDRNRLLWRAEARQSAMVFVDNVVYLHNYRYLFAFDPWSGKLRWVFANPRIDIVTSEDARTAVLYASADGDIGILDGKTGAQEILVKTGLRLSGGAFDADGMTTQAKVSDADLAKRLEQIIWDPDSRFTAVKVFAARALAELPGTEATLGLIRIVQKDSGVSPTVQKSAGERLIARKDAGAEQALFEALKAGHFDYLATDKKRGAEVFARAIAELDSKNTQRAVVDEIVAHLRDPETSSAALPDLVKALLGLGRKFNKEVTSALTEFLLTYRADPSFLTDPTALTLAADALLVVGGSEGRRTVMFVAGDDKSISPLKVEAAKLLTPKK